MCFAVPSRSGSCPPVRPQPPKKISSAFAPCSGTSGCLIFYIRCTHPAIQRSLSSILNPARRESTREDGKRANGLVRTAVRCNAGGDEQDVEDVQCSAHCSAHCNCRGVPFRGTRGDAASRVSTPGKL